MADDAPRLAIAMGDPAGISPELLAKLLGRPELMELAAVTVIGDRRVLALGEKAAGIVLEIETAGALESAAAQPSRPVFVDLAHLDPATIPMAQATAEGGAFAMRNFGAALLAAKARRFDGIMFTPFNKLAFKRAGNPYPDEIRWAADLLGWNGACSEYNKLDDLWNARVTSHEPLRDVANLLTQERIVAAIEATTATLRRAGVARPRIAVAGFNPHAGEGGVFGREEIDVIAPAVERRRSAARWSTGRSRPTRSGCARGAATMTPCSPCITTRGRSRSSCSASSAASRSSAACRSRSRRRRTARLTTSRARVSPIRRRRSRRSARW